MTVSEVGFYWKDPRKLDQQEQYNFGTELVKNLLVSVLPCKANRECPILDKKIGFCSFGILEIMIDSKLASYDAEFVILLNKPLFDIKGNNINHLNGRINAHQKVTNIMTNDIFYNNKKLQLPNERIYHTDLSYLCSGLNSVRCSGCELLRSRDKVRLRDLLRKDKLE